MKKNYIALCTLITALNLAVISISKAEDFNLTVPVQLQNLLPEVDGGKVICHAYIGPDWAYNKKVGSGETEFSINPNTNNYSGNVVVRFDAEQNKDPSTATHYRCVLNVKSGNSSAVPSVKAAALWANPKPGTELIPIVDDSLYP